MSRPLIVFRTEGGSRVGLGHVVRCLALAGRLTPPARCVFATATSDGRVLGKVAAAGHEVVSLEPNGSPKQAARVVAGLLPQAVVVDLPEADAADYHALRSGAALLVVIDDCGPADCPADIIVNGTAVSQFHAYAQSTETQPALHTAGQLLLGPSYMILRDEFARCGARQRAFPPLARSVVVSMGGADQLGLTPRVVRALHSVEAIERCLIIVGPICQAGQAIRRAAEACPARESRMTCRIVTDPPAMAPLLYGADLAITSGGMTMYEAAAVGTPTIALPQAASQLIEIEEFARRGAVAPVSRRNRDRGPGPCAKPGSRPEGHRDPKDAGARVKSNLQSLWGWRCHSNGMAEPPALTHLATTARTLAANPQHRKEMSRCARALVDGRGAQRVAAAVLQRLAALVPLGMALPSQRDGRATPH